MIAFYQLNIIHIYYDYYYYTIAQKFYLNNLEFSKCKNVSIDNLTCHTLIRHVSFELVVTF